MAAQTCRRPRLATVQARRVVMVAAIFASLLRKEREAQRLMWVDVAVISAKVRYSSSAGVLGTPNATVLEHGCAHARGPNGIFPVGAT